MRYELTDHECTAIKPMLPNKPRGVARVNDRRVLNGIFWVLRSGAPWRDLPESFGLHHLLQSHCSLAAGFRIALASLLLTRRRSRQTDFRAGSLAPGIASSISADSMVHVVRLCYVNSCDRCTCDVNRRIFLKKAPASCADSAAPAGPDGRNERNVAKAI